jgi:arginine/lysine/ornithine decarboxylase
MLHISGSGRIDIGAVARALRLLHSTSPSSLLLASLDSARRQLALHGEQLLFETLEAIQVARAKFETIPGIATVDASLIGHKGVAGYDPMRIVLDVRGTGRTGYEIADALRRSYDVHVELPMQATIVFVVGLGESAVALRRLAGDVDEVVKRLSEPGATAPIVPPATSLRNEVALPPREAFLGEAEQVAVDDAIGRISCESIASYPPGVPALLPGERISRETVVYLRELAASGARLHGASDPAFETINVLREGSA